MASVLENDILRKRHCPHEKCEKFERSFSPFVFFLYRVGCSASTGLSLVFRSLIFDREKEDLGSVIFHHISMSTSKGVV